MCLDGHTVGGLNILHTTVTILTEAQLHLAQTLADLAVLGLAQESSVNRADRLFEHTLGALNTRVHVAQAIGLIAGILDISTEEARTALVGTRPGWMCPCGRSPARSPTALCIRATSPRSSPTRTADVLCAIRSVRDA